MAISKTNLLGILFAAEQGVIFTNTLTIGRQQVYDGSEVRKKLLKYNPAGELPTSDFQYAEGVFAFLGAKTTDSIDYSDYESATIISDMSKPVDIKYHNKYSCVYDGGCLEHIFNYPIAIKNCMDMVSPGGHLILNTPANNYFGHGLYQFSPELFFSLLRPDNGFSDTKIYMQNDWGRWFEVASPSEIKCRVDICCAKNSPSMLFVISHKTGNVPDVLSVHQSDYTALYASDVDPASFLSNFGGLRLSGIKMNLFKLFHMLPLCVREKFRSSALIRRILLKNNIKFYTPVKDFNNIRKSIQ